MIQYERQNSILKILGQKQTASVKELASELFASEASIRRDIIELENKGCVRRIYGGVILSQYSNRIVPLYLRDSENSAVKNAIAKRAAEMVSDNASIMLDASSTTRRIVKYLKLNREMKIITNNMRIFNEIETDNVTLYCTGGIYNPKNHAFVGHGAEEYIRSVYADILFFSSQGISEDGEITDVSEEETALRKVMLSRVKYKVFLCDSSKIGIKKTFKVCTKDDVDTIICDTKLPWEL